MKNLRVVKVDSESLTFDNGIVLYSDHQPDCCEYHWLCFEHLNIEDFKYLDFDLSGDDFFRRIEDYGIEIIPNNGWSVRIPGYGSNNGYYSSDLSLILSNEDGRGVLKRYDISECQVITG